jgi:hypothetical protein
MIFLMFLDITSSGSESERKKRFEEAKKKTTALFTPYEKEPLRKLSVVEGLEKEEEGSEKTKRGANIKGQKLVGKEDGRKGRVPTKAHLGRVEGEEVNDVCMLTY